MALENAASRERARTLVALSKTAFKNMCVFVAALIAFRGEPPSRSQCSLGIERSPEKKRERETLEINVFLYAVPVLFLVARRDVIT